MGPQLGIHGYFLKGAGNPHFLHSRCRGIENKSLPLSIISFILEIFDIETVENSVTLSILTTRALVVKYMKQYLISFKEKGGK